MRKSTFLYSAVLWLAAVSPAVTGAQFQPVNPDELKMTSDPKAPGADAVYLEMSEIDNDALHFRTYSARIKVLTEKGKELATVTAPFFKGNTGIREVHARTIHTDGTVIPLNVKPEDLLIVKSGDEQLEQKVFTLPDVDVGSILEYSFDLQYRDDVFLELPRWEIQRRCFVHKAHYEFRPGAVFSSNLTDVWSTDAGASYFDNNIRLQKMAWAERLPKGVDVQRSVDGRFTLDLTDVPAIPDEEWMPPVGSLAYEVSFHPSSPSGDTVLWNVLGKAWSKEVDNFAESPKSLKDAVAELIAPGDSDLDKARKLYAAVQAVDNTDYSRKKSASERHQLKLKEEKHAGDTWTQKSGGSNAIALLYLAMLRAAGLTAHATEMVDRDKGIFDPTYISLDQLDSVLVILDSGGKQIVLDPGEKMCPFQTLNWRHSLASGLGQSAQGPSFTTTPTQQYANNTVRRTGILTLDAKGVVTGQLQIAMTGQEALRWRQMALENDLSEVKKQFDDELAAIAPEGVEAHVDHFAAIDDPNANLLAVVNIEGSIGATTAKRLVVPGLFFAGRGREPFVSEEKRLLPVDIQYARQVTDQLTYDLPAGISVEGAPQDAKVSWEGHAVYIVKTKPGPGQITVARLLANAFTIAKPEEYQDLRGFYQKVAAADQAQLVLSIAPDAKGY